MTVTLRQYQEDLLSGIFNAWNAGHKSVLAVSPTGSGKAYSAATVVQRYGQPALVRVHRAELVAQLSESLADVGITHRVIASKSTVAMCVARHVKKYGRSFVHPQSPVGLASVQTLVKRLDKLRQWLSTIKLCLTDEGHHAVAAQYTTIDAALPDDCRHLYVTATPDRCDRKSMARVQGGVADVMVEGPTSGLSAKGILVRIATLRRHRRSIWMRVTYRPELVNIALMLYGRSHTSRVSSVISLRVIRSSHRVCRLLRSL
jgi:superfamily II DNA or RNA helicase